MRSPILGWPLRLNSSPNVGLAFDDVPRIDEPRVNECAVDERGSFASPFAYIAVTKVRTRQSERETRVAHKQIEGRLVRFERQLSMVFFSSSFRSNRYNEADSLLRLLSNQTNSLANNSERLYLRWCTMAALIKIEDSCLIKEQSDRVQLRRNRGVDTDFGGFFVRSSEQTSSEQTTCSQSAHNVCVLRQFGRSSHGSS